MRKLASFLKLLPLVRLSVAVNLVWHAGGSNATDNANYLTATYKIAQNMLARLSYVTQSGDLSGHTANAKTMGSNVTALNLYILF